MEISYSEKAKIFKGFCDPTRLQVLEMLQSGEKCACVLLEQVAVGQPTLSHHMKILIDSGVVQARKDGKWTHYSINEAGVKRAKETLNGITKFNLSEILVCK